MEIHNEKGLRVEAIRSASCSDLGVVYEGYTDEKNVRGDGETQRITFQHGPFEGGMNGWTSEAMVKVLIHRLKLLDQRQPCEENHWTLKHLGKTLTSMNARQKRIDQKLQMDQLAKMNAPAQDEASGD